MPTGPQKKCTDCEMAKIDGIAAESVTTLPNGVISAIAMFVIRQNASSAWVLYVVTSATKNSATNAKITSTVKSVERYSA